MSIKQKKLPEAPPISAELIDWLRQVFPCEVPRSSKNFHDDCIERRGQRKVIDRLEAERKNQFPK